MVEAIWKENLNFTVDQETIDETLSQLLSSTPDADEVRSLQPEQSLSQPLDEYFVCDICTSVVNNPSQCEDCN